MYSETCLYCGHSIYAYYYMGFKVSRLCFNLCLAGQQLWSAAQGDDRNMQYTHMFRYCTYICTWVKIMVYFVDAIECLCCTPEMKGYITHYTMLRNCFSLSPHLISTQVGVESETIHAYWPPQRIVSPCPPNNNSIYSISLILLQWYCRGYGALSNASGPTKSW